MLLHAVNLQAINNSRLMWGLAMIMVNTGSRYVIADLSKFHEKLLTHELFKKVILFCMFFMGTRDIMIAMILTFSFSIVMQTLLDERSRFSILPHGLRHALLDAARQQHPDHQHMKPVSHEQYKEALATVRRYEARVHNAKHGHQSQAQAHTLAQSTPSAVTLVDRYMPSTKNLQLR